MLLILMVLVHFGQPDVVTVDSWRIVNDGVMGGLSRSELLTSDEGTALFRGILSLENRGGFASVRADLTQHDYSGATHVEYRVRGDGRRYQLRLRNDDGFDGVAYKHEFDTEKGKWITGRASVADFEASFRGMRVPGAPPLDTGDLRQLGFLIADKTPGPFSLEIEYVQAVIP